jgi:SAM-dependent MidA family methyltransferase
MDRNILMHSILQHIIQRDGPLTFAEFLRLALYHPQNGYYRRHEAIQVGRDGDFMTSISAGPVYGRIWAGVFRDWLKDGSLGADARITEFGGNRGRFRADVLAAAPELRHEIVEAGDPMPDRLEGIVFSNELIDALPFHRLRVRDGRWREIRVDLGPDGLRELETDPVPELSTCFPISLAAQPPAALPDGTEFEARPAALAWIRDVARRLVRGRIVTVDYGFTHEEYFSRPRPRGTLRCYHRHTLNDEPLARPGEQDITADVDFTEFIAAGEAAGLRTERFEEQGRALLELGREVVQELARRDAGTFSRERNALHQLTHPTLMGRRFRVLIQRKP